MAHANRTFDPDTELMLRFQRGDDASFQRLTERYRMNLVEHLSRRIRNPAVAEELVQDVFLRIYRARHRWEPSAKFSTWLFRISVNVTRNHFRDNRWRNRDISLDRELADLPKLDFPDRSASAEEELLLRARRQEIREAVNALPHRQRRAVLMHKCEERDYRQIADELGCTIAALKAMMFRAHEQLRGQLGHLV